MLTPPCSSLRLASRATPLAHRHPLTRPAQPHTTQSRLHSARRSSACSCPSRVPGDFTRIYGFHKPDKQQPIIFYCRAGVRAGTAVDLAKRAGYKKSVGTASWPLPSVPVFGALADRLR